MKIKTVRQLVGGTLTEHGWENDITYLKGVRKGKGFNFFVKKNGYAHNITIKNLDEVLKGKDIEASLKALGKNFAYNLEEQLTIQLLSEKSVDKLEDSISEEVDAEIVEEMNKELGIKKKKTTKPKTKPKTKTNGAQTSKRI